VIIYLTENIRYLFIYFCTATSEELFDSLVGNSPEKQSLPEKKPLISSSGEDSPIKFASPKKGNK